MILIIITYIDKIDLIFNTFGRQNKKGNLTTRGFEPLPFQNSALNYRLRPLGHIVSDALLHQLFELIIQRYINFY